MAATFTLPPFFNINKKSRLKTPQPWEKGITIVYKRHNHMPRIRDASALNAGNTPTKQCLCARSSRRRCLFTYSRQPESNQADGRMKA